MQQKDENTLMTKVLLGEASEQDVEQLRQHADSQSMEEIIEADDLARRYQFYSEADYQQALDHALEVMKGERRGARTTARHRWAVAAAIGVLVALGGLVWLRQYTKVVPPELGQELLVAIQQSEQAGRVEAVVESLPQPALFPKKNGTKATQSVPSTHSSSVEGEAVEQLLAAKRITTKSDKEYWLTLPDGSLVHLSYNTRVIYPERFNGESRDVILEGEAYFMVAKDRRHPFIVHTPQGDVKVYGTEFMLKALPASPINPVTDNKSIEADGGTETDTYVVLVRGSLSVTPTMGTEQMLRPGQKLSIDRGQTTIEDVDTAPYVAWNEGMFLFTNWPLERIVSVLSRWYGKQFAFADDELRHVKLSGNLYRYGQIDPTMRALEKVAGITVCESQNVLMIDY